MMMQRLSDTQQRLVENNIGLVGVHMKHLCSGPAGRRDKAEWDDLYQEGCLGLMTAATRFNAAQGLQFAPYALARIRKAVSNAMEKRQDMAPHGTARTDPGPRTTSALELMETKRTSPDRHRLWAETENNRPTLGEHVRRR